MDQRGDGNAQQIEHPAPLQRENHRDGRDADRGGLLDTGEHEGVAPGGKEQEDRQRIVHGIALHEDDIARDGQKCPEHQEILRRHAVQLQLIIDPVKERVCADALVRGVPCGLGDQLVAVAVRARVVAPRAQACKARKQKHDQQRAQQQPAAPPRALRPQGRQMIRTPRQRDRHEHEDD